MKILDIDNNFQEISGTIDPVNSHYWILLPIDEVEKLDDFISVDRETIDECRSFSQASKINFFNGYIFIIFNVLNYVEKIVISRELNVFLSRNYIITVYKDKIDILENLIRDIRGWKNCFVLKDNPRVCILLYCILDRIVMKNYDIISELEVEADKIEINILKSPRQDQIDNLITLRRQVYKIRKYLSPLIYIGDSLTINDNLVIERESIKYFISLDKKIEKLMISLESLVQDLALVREAFESEIANKTNELMKIFTVIATIFLPLNLISSIYGTNLKGVPFMEVENGCHYVMIIMLLIALILICIFKRKRWL
ncbi:magnesium transporter CorA family protein [Clostridium luticellarii]|uniref:Magnesium transport protein CorA n=1 Tax=Clostridium luticellarii TaxID=1691940 RepID=A0A2T0B505_9CLOT|nr:magnesium transporter CorA family protein [Clostridium luticellarii]MCI1945102.1 magnesium transporter CorA family protein [Clostridium luticellarii]MCI1968595.1 magnesium transporter CorA family protein [Clostridium luticellarii]MCI1995899.1 magnesium transporter CorA family protein [Clostridium luticellarii]MCI2041327.1 magnesium transporter CorA family protein [Clostridium luticellarii]PRR78952.1 Magnesium transport protein CorA [Clostridium luticellarii]